ncbi:nitroreductase family protein [Actinoplanes sp. NPDC026619]|uniref:Acg family FMN-binding oxidoreductase n=1 Tax=Actinoplanes sp. NPDC026619 TaxID=3155798 RepID=UPI0034043F14
MDSYTEADLHRAVEAAVRAPSLHNSQPWLFRLAGGAIEILADPARRLPAIDRTGWAARLAVGAATYNARLALAASGRPAEVRLHPEPREPGLIARLTPARERPPTYAETELFDAVPRRHSNRQPFWPDPVPTEVRVRLIDAARSESSWLALLVGTVAVAGFSEIAHSADRVLQRDTAYLAEMETWRHAIPDYARAPLAEPQDILPQRFFNERRRAPGHDYEPEPLVGILGVPGDTAADQSNAGQAMQKVLLTATAAGLDTSLISQPIEVPAARDQLRRSLGRPGHPQIVIRFGYGMPSRPTPRREVSEVLTGSGTLVPGIPGT